MMLLQATKPIQEVQPGTSNSGSANQRFESSLPSQSDDWPGAPLFRQGEGRSFSLDRPAEPVGLTLILGALVSAPVAFVFANAPFSGSALYLARWVVRVFLPW
jgi:hypothetical protein